MPKKIQDSDMVGKVFGRLQVLSRNQKDYWKCVCNCGNTSVIVRSGKLLRNGQSKSCGCLQKENAIRQSLNNTGVPKTHGKTRTPEYRVWVNMKARCLDPNSQAYKNYGGRGISVCERWKESFETFLRDMGERPSDKYSLDRTDNDGDYEPSNCKWVTAKEQANNRRGYGSSKYLGVSWCNQMKKWKGTCKGIHVGYFENEEIVNSIHEA